MKKILLAEDDDSMRRLLEVILRKENYTVLSAADGLEAMQTAFANDIDLLVADAIMPHLSGYDLCRMIRENPAKKHIPIVILSGLDQPEKADAEDCLYDIFLIKNAQLKKNLPAVLRDLL